MATRKENPLSAVQQAALVGLAAVTIAGVAAASSTKPRRGKGKKKQNSLEGVFERGATFGDVPEIVEDIELPIEFSQEPEARDDMGQIANAGTNKIDTQDQLRVIVTNLKPDVAKDVYATMKNKVAEEGVDFSQGEERDKVLMEVMPQVAPGVDWSKGLMPYTYGSPEAETWIGVQLIGEAAHQSYYNKQAKKESEA